MICVAVSALVAASELYFGQYRSPGEDHVDLVPMLGSGVPPRHFVLGFAVEECIADAQTVVAAELQQSLPIIVHAARTEMAYACGPGVKIRSNSGVEVPQDEQWLFFGNPCDGSIQFVIELVFVILS